MHFVFDSFELEPELHRLVDEAGREITLRPQAFKVLEYLVQRAPSVVSKDELLEEVWGHSALSVSGVSQAIREIRRALDDDASQPRIIATRHGCGYQIVASVVSHDGTSASPDLDDGESLTGPHSPLATMAVFGLLLIGLVAGSYWFRPIPEGVLTVGDSGLNTLTDLDSPSLPEGEEARTAFLEGVRALRRMDWVQAAERFGASVEGDPNSVSARLGLVDSFLRAGHEAKARDLVNHPVLRLGNLSRRGRLEVRAQIARLSGDWTEVANCMRSLSEFFPQQIEYQFDLFEALLASSPPTLAQDTLDEIARMLPGESPGARYYLALNALKLREHQPGDALVAARKALDDTKSGGKDSLYARSEIALGRSLARIDRLAEARDAFGRAAEEMRAGRNEYGWAEAQLELARLNLRQHRLEHVRERMEPACKVLGGMGSSHGMARCTRLEGELMAIRGHRPVALSLLAQSAYGFDRTGWLNDAADAYLELGRQQLDAGMLDDAEDSLVAAEQRFQRVGNRVGYAWTHHSKGRLMHQRGLIVEARIAYSDAYVVFRGLADREGEAAAARGMSRALGLEGKAVRALELLDSTIALYRELNEYPELAESLFDAGMLAGNSGDLFAAERYLGEAAKLLVELGNRDKATLALAELSRVYIDQAQAVKARQTLADAAALEPDGDGYRASLDSVSGYLALLEGDRELAAELFTSSRAIRGGMGDGALDLQSKLDYARLYIERGQAEQAESAARYIVEHIDQSDGNALVAHGFVVLVESLEMQGQTREAREELVRMERLGLPEASVKVDLAYQILLGKLDMVADAPTHLRDLRERANGLGYRLMALETDVALASKLLGSGQLGAGHELAAAVMERARQTGMIYVAERAMRLNQPKTKSAEPRSD